MDQKGRNPAPTIGEPDRRGPREPGRSGAAFALSQTDRSETRKPLSRKPFSKKFLHRGLQSVRRKGRL